MPPPRFVCTNPVLYTTQTRKQTHSRLYTKCADLDIATVLSDDPLRHKISDVALNQSRMRAARGYLHPGHSAARDNKDLCVLLIRDEPASGSCRRRRVRGFSGRLEDFKLFS